VIGVSINFASIITIFQLHFGTVATMWHILYFILRLYVAAPAYMEYIYLKLIKVLIFQSLWFLYWFLWGLMLWRKILNKGLVKMKSSLWKFYGRHYDLVNRYGISVSQITIWSFPHPWLITGFARGVWRYRRGNQNPYIEE
jgi:hypothetical protein